MVDRRGNPWALLAIGAMAVVVLTVGWAALRGGGAASHHVLRHAAEAMPDIRPQLPEAPKPPDPPIPIPK